MEPTATIWRFWWSFRRECCLERAQSKRGWIWLFQLERERKRLQPAVRTRRVRFVRRQRTGPIVPERRTVRIVRCVGRQCRQPGLQCRAGWAGRFGRFLRQPGVQSARRPQDLDRLFERIFPRQRGAAYGIEWVQYYAELRLMFLSGGVFKAKRVRKKLILPHSKKNPVLRTKNIRKWLGEG
uniref:Uncharacterized protein n=1 Tax=Anopheles quadriannulatus TaxID=34691 RepID=A0A904A677_ANOQN